MDPEKAEAALNALIDAFGVKLADEYGGEFHELQAAIDAERED